jgi:two-component system, OmpR family, sensor histidine kinase BaeS
VLRSVRSRVVAVAIGVAIVSVAVSSWLATRTTGAALRGEAERSLELDTSIYRQLLEFGSTNATWDGVEDIVGELATSTGRRIALVDGEGVVFADSDSLDGGRARALPRAPTAQIDPSAPLVGIGTRQRLVALDEQTLAQLNIVALAAGKCLQANGIEFSRFDSVSSGPRLVPRAPLTEEADNVAYLDCVADLDDATAEITAANAKVATSKQNKPTAPPIALYLGTRAENPLSLSGGELARVIGLGAIVAGIAALVAWLLGRRITRPFVALAAASRQLGAGNFETQVPIESDDEVGELAVAFNSMATSLSRTETARRRMTADIAHELRNPLVTIHGTLEAIQDGVYEPSPEVIESMIEETVLLRRIVNDLQDLAAIDAGTVRIEPRDIDIVELCSSLVEAHRATAPAIELAVVAPEPVTAAADPDRVRQIVGNLLSNAIRHTPPEGTVTVSVTNTEVNALIEVADSGIGIAPEELTHVFERLWRADSSRSRGTGGSGLGLSIARGLARAQGGDISARTSVGRGTTFSLRLPRHAAAPAAPTKRAANQASFDTRR